MSTIKDVAKYANVSIGTVSKYINGIPIREDNRERIQEAIKQLDYRVNATARSLKTQKSNLIAVLMESLIGSYYPYVVQEIEHLLYTKGYNVVILNSNGDPLLEKKKIDIMLEKKVDGFLIFPLSTSEKNYRELIMEGVPLVLVDLCIPDVPCNQVVTDNVGILFRVTSALIAKGHRKIGLITGKPSNLTAYERLQGYCQAYESFGITPRDSDILTIGFSNEHGRAGAQRLLESDEPPTALITCNYHTTAGAAQYIAARRISVPAQLDWVGFDYDDVALLTQRPIPVVTQDIPRIAKTAVNCLLTSILQPETAKYAVYRIEANLSAPSKQL